MMNRFKYYTANSKKVVNEIIHILHVEYSKDDGYLLNYICRHVSNLVDNNNISLRIVHCLN